MMYRARLALACLGMAAAVPPGHAEAPNWSYSGATGPDRWGDLSPAYSACNSGTQQSPVDLRDAVAADLAGAAVNWSAVEGGQVENTGQTLRVEISGAGGLTLDGRYYELRHFKFHHRSEHTIDGRDFPMEIQFVHAGADGALAVLGVFVEEGEENAALNLIWTTAPGAVGKAAVSFTIDPTAFLPDDARAYRYAGSLTAPPCSEIVAWSVLKTPIHASASQIAALAALFPNNARPVQDLHRRFILETR